MAVNNSHTNDQTNIPQTQNFQLNSDNFINFATTPSTPQAQAQQNIRKLSSFEEGIYFFGGIKKLNSQYCPTSIILIAPVKTGKFIPVWCSQNQVLEKVIEGNCLQYPFAIKKTDFMSKSKQTVYNKGVICQPDAKVLQKMFDATNQNDF
jgi:hypothetical protein